MKFITLFKIWSYKIYFKLVSALPFTNSNGMGMRTNRLPIPRHRLEQSRPGYVYPAF